MAKNSTEKKMTSLPAYPADNSQLKKSPFLFYLKNNKRAAALGILSLVIVNALDALPPLLIGRAIDQISRGTEWIELSKTLGLLILAAVVLSIFRYAWRMIWGTFHHGVADNLRGRIFKRFTDLSQGFFQNKTVGGLMSLITNDVVSFRMAIGPGVLIIVDGLIILLIIPPMMMSISVDWTWKTLVLMPLVPFFVYKLISRIQSSFTEQRDRFADMSGSAQEIVAGVRVIKSYVQEDHQTHLFNNYSSRFETACNRVAKLDSFFTPTLELSVTIGSVILLLVGSPQVISGSLTVGQFFAFYQYIQRMVWPMTALGMGVSFLQKGKASIGRILEVLESQSDVPDLGTKQIDKFKSLKVIDLGFRYPGHEKWVLKNVSFELYEGESLGIVGPLGSGKSTLIDVLCRVYPFQEGMILINDIPIQEISQSNLKSLFSIVPQDAFLFSDRIDKNLALGRENWTQSDLHSSVEMVDLKNEINEIPGGWQAQLGERGVSLSGGQKQRLTIARALLKPSPILVLDDSLSAVDAKTEKRILKNLKKQLDVSEGLSSAHKTSIIVSHRLASLRWADKILVLSKGQVEAVGTHLSLLHSSDSYRGLAHIQGQGEV